MTAMTTVLKDSTPFEIPAALLRKAGLKAGDSVEIKVSGGVIAILPVLPVAHDEYTAEQRQRIDAELTEASKGPYYGPFETADAAIKFLKKEIPSRKRKTAPPVKR